MISISDQSDFSIHNIPFGIFSTADRSKRAGCAIGHQIIDLQVLADKIDLGFDRQVLSAETLNNFIGLGKQVTSHLRARIQAWLRDDASVLYAQEGIFVEQSDAQMHMPVHVGDYTDFYSSIEHATNVGKMFRDPANALLPNWRHLPVGYHGRASSIVVSGAPLHRPCGQLMPKGADQPIYGPTGRLDFELEMAFIIGKENGLGNPISVNDAEDYIFGMVIFNDWSARDIQKWEYVPLGPFLGKNFGSSISPWIVTMEALDHFRVSGPTQQPAVLDYLSSSGDRNYDISLEVGIQPHGSEEAVVCRSNFKYMYWNMCQQLAHHTVNGCNVRIGDMLASGTISGKDESSYGSMLELSWAGSKSLPMTDGTERKFIHDGDTVKMRAFAQKDGRRVGFGEVSTQILPHK